MNIILQNIPKYKKILSEDISALFHDMSIINILISPDKMTLVIKRPCYERSKDQKLLGFISMCRIPSVETVIDVTGIKSVKKEEDDKGYDWFLSFDIDEGRKFLIIRSVLNAYFLEYSDTTKIHIKDREKENWSDCSLIFRKPKERNIKAINDIINNLWADK